MSDEEKNERSASQGDRSTVKHIRPPNIPSVYVNSSSIVMGFFELRLYLAETAPSGELDGASTITDKLCLLLSPEFANALAEQIAAGVKHYEDTFGKLRPTSGVIKESIPPPNEQPEIQETKH